MPSNTSTRDGISLEFILFSSAINGNGETFLNEAVSFKLVD